MRGPLIFTAAIGLFIVFLNHQFPGVFEDTDSTYRLFYLLLILLFIGGGTFASFRSEWRKQLGQIGAWLGIFLLLIVGYTYSDEVMDSKFGAELMPGRTTIEADGSITLYARADGHFYINARINGEKLRFMIDTGASDIMLTQATAERVGLEISPNAKKRIYSTANGTSSGLAVDIPRMEIGGAYISNVRAYVSQGEMGTNLLGQSFMNRLSSYNVEGGKMTLAP